MTLIGVINLCLFPIIDRLFYINIHNDRIQSKNTRYETYVTPVWHEEKHGTMMNT